MNIEGAIKDLQKLCDKEKDPKVQLAIFNEIKKLMVFKDFISKK